MKKSAPCALLAMLVLSVASCSISKPGPQATSNTAEPQGPPEKAASNGDYVTVTVDATRPAEELKHVWSYYGYDEANYTTAPDCISRMKTVQEIKPSRFISGSISCLTAGTARPASNGDPRIYTPRMTTAIRYTHGKSWTQSWMRSQPRDVCPWWKSDSCLRTSR